MRDWLENPVLPGFHPDPSLLCVGADFYIATSTFEWFPGVRLHHSRDLVHWQPIGYALDRPAQLDLRGNPRSGGVWAPCLSYAQGRFYLVYTNVRAWGNGFMDAHNYVVTAERIEGRRRRYGTPAHRTQHPRRSPATARVDRGEGGPGPELRHQGP